MRKFYPERRVDTPQDNRLIEENSRGCLKQSRRLTEDQFGVDRWVQGTDYPESLGL